MIRAFRRIGLLTVSTLLTAVTTVLVIPLVISGASAAAWSHLVVGQNIGIFVAVVTAWGWAITGPVAVATAGAEERVDLYRRSLSARAVLLLPSAAAVLVLVPLLVPADGAVSTLSALAVLVGALGGSWFFVGCGDGARLLLVDTLPRVLGTLTGAVAVGLGAPLVWVPLCQIVGAAVAAALAGWVILRGRTTSFHRLTRRPLLTSLREQSNGVLTAAASSLYLALPLVLVSRLAPLDAPSYALADRLLRYGVLAAAPIAGFAQSWLPSGDSASLGRRARLARRAALGFGALGGVVYLAAAPLVARLLSAGLAGFGMPLAMPYSLSAAAILASQVIGLAVLLALGRGGSLAASTAIGLIVGVTLVPVGAVLLGGPGAAWGLAISEISVLAVQLTRSGPRAVAAAPAHTSVTMSSLTGT